MMQAKKYQSGRHIEIERDGSFVTGMTRSEAKELLFSLAAALDVSPVNIASGNAVVGQQIGSVETWISDHDAFGEQW